FLTHGEGLADTTTLAADHHALEHLDALLGALDDLDVHVDGVARAENRDVVAQRRLIDEVQPVHLRDTSLRSRPTAATTRWCEAVVEPMVSGFLAYLAAG